MNDALLSLDGFCKVKWVHEQTVCVCACVRVCVCACVLSVVA